MLGAQGKGGVAVGEGGGGQAEVQPHLRTGAKETGATFNHHA